jgi:hypothetical protein
MVELKELRFEEVMSASPCVGSLREVVFGAVQAEIHQVGWVVRRLDLWYARSPESCERYAVSLLHHVHQARFCVGDIG